jgi:hypothetical protein
MPNGVGVDCDRLPVVDARGAALVSDAALVVDGVCILLPASASWNPRASVNAGFGRDEVSRRGRDLLRAVAALEGTTSPLAPRTCSYEPLYRLARVLDALCVGRGDQAAAAASCLIGRGGGLTPAGDDALAAGAATLFAFGSPAGLALEERAAWLEALAPTNLRARTNSLAATLAELAACGYVMEPMRAVLDLSANRAQWGAAVRNLLAVGHSTGRAWALACATTARRLAGSN